MSSSCQTLKGHSSPPGVSVGSQASYLILWSLDWSPSLLNLEENAILQKTQKINAVWLTQKPFDLASGQILFMCVYRREETGATLIKIQGWLSRAVSAVSYPITHVLDQLQEPCTAVSPASVTTVSPPGVDANQAVGLIQHLYWTWSLGEGPGQNSLMITLGVCQEPSLKMSEGKGTTHRQAGINLHCSARLLSGFLFKPVLYQVEQTIQSNPPDH